jgi:hypothetical protein
VEAALASIDAHPPPERAMSCIPYVLEPSGNGWRLGARGFTWYFESRQKAIAFALSTARDFTDATGQPTSVRVAADDGTIRELRAFGGLSRTADQLLSLLRLAP